MNVQPQDQYLDTAQAAHYLGKSKSTLEWWRGDNRGPRYYKIGSRVSYKQTDLDAFMSATGTKPSARRRSARVRNCLCCTASSCRWKQR